MYRILKFMIRGTVKQYIQSSSIKIDVSADYFKAIYDPNDRRYLKSELQVMFEELNVDISASKIMNAINS